MLLTFQEDQGDLSGELGCSALITVTAVVMLSWQLLLKATNQTQQSNPGSWWVERKKKAWYLLFVHFTFHSEYPRFHHCSLLSLLRNAMSRQASLLQNAMSRQARSNALD